MVKDLLEDSRVKLGTAIACVIAVVAYVRYDTAWRTTVDHRFERMAETMDRIDKRIVGKAPDGWHRRDMLEYSIEAERLNKDWNSPSVKWE